MSGAASGGRVAQTRLDGGGRQAGWSQACNDPGGKNTGSQHQHRLLTLTYTMHPTLRTVIGRNVCPRLLQRQTLRPSPIAVRAFSASAPTQQAPPAPVEPKIATIVDSIAQLNLLQTAALVQALKTKLNIQDIVMPVAAAAPAGGAAAAAPAAEEKPAEKTEFKVKLEKFDAASKAKIIKEIKALLPGANLVEAKKFVESVPKVIRENANKEEAEKIKKTLEALGATVILE
ncbi:ribosomal protein L7/L12 C-terminal domain-containing protein [Fimicolochytrium jonesii]|uniref:ribosomal protein L7/L12 C-terminal domain-containing protein n=1 Tax=Fimicolochytrium jonesii TaxID=1396493 RepID=UPI0022FE2C95|nr:ribosomal protein L7/L12 C-terminal domain-containing protein [Fimicolochytrium jonesii]KAI8815665.1 ribosomal protein L7/L12 C-terminal domain-containing protein [Fimicolochytrium jonesii]